LGKLEVPLETFKPAGFEYSVGSLVCFSISIRELCTLLFSDEVVFSVSGDLQIENS